MKDSVSLANSKTWSSIQKYSNVSFLDPSFLPHSKFIFGVFDALLALLYQLSFISYVDGATSDNEDFRSKFHSWLNRLVLNSIRLKELPEVYKDVTSIVLLVGSVTTIAFFVKITFEKTTNIKDHALVSHRFIILITACLFMILYGPVIHLVFYQIAYRGIGMKLVSIGLLLLLPLLLLIHNALTYDFQFKKSNYIQGRNYYYFVSRIVALLVVATIRLILMTSNSIEAKVGLNFANFCIATFLIVFRIVNDNFFYLPKFDKLTLFFNVVYMWESFFQMMILLFHNHISFVDTDLYSLAMIPFLFFLVQNLSNYKSKKVLNVGSHNLQENLSDAIYFLELLQFIFDQQEKSKHKIQLYKSAIKHTKLCTDEKCLCFLLIERVDSSVGVRTGKNSKQIFRHYHLDSKGKKANGLTMFDDQMTVTTLKALHNTTVTARLLNDSQTVQLAVDPDENRADTAEVYNVESLDQFRLVMCSFFQSLPRIYSLKTVVFDAVFSFIQYLLYEYQNPISSLMLVYKYVYSASYKYQSNWFRDYLLQNCIAKSKIVLDLSGNTSKSGLPKLNLTKVLNYRERVHELRSKNKDLLLKKIDLYSLIAKKQVDYKFMVDTGSKLYDMLSKMTVELDELLTMSANNTKLTREALLFELCVLERPYVSEKLSNKYKQALIDMRNRVGSVYNMTTQKFFSTYNSSNIVVFAENRDKTFRIRNFTQNAIHLFGLQSKDLYGSKLTEFMPKDIAQVHDRLLLNFMNGESNSMRGGKFNIFVISKLNTSRSCMIFPKLELTLQNDISIAALFSLRKKNNYPLIYTDLYGNVVGSNKPAQKVLMSQGNLANINLFTLFPRLFKIYYNKTGHDYKKFLHFENLSKTLMKEHQLESKALEDTYNKENSSDGFSNKTLENLYLFQMLAMSKTMSKSDTDVGTSTGNLSTRNNENISWGNNRHHRSKRSTEMSPLMADISKKVTVQRKEIATNLSKIFKVKAELETNHFQMHLSYREICLENVQKTGGKTHQFFKAFSSDSNPFLLDALMLSPEGVSNYFRLASLFARVSVLEGVLNSNSAITESITKDKARSKSNDIRALSNKYIATKNSFQISDSFSILPKFDSEGNIHKSVARSEMLKVIEVKDTLNISGTNSLNNDIFNANIKPYQLDDDMPLGLSEDEDYIDTNYRNQFSTQTKQYPNAMSPKLAKDKLKKLKPQLQDLRNEIEKEESVQFKIETIMKTIIYKCFGTSRAASHHEEILPVEKSKGTEPTEGTSIKMEVGLEEQYSNLFNENTMSVLDSEESLRVEQTDPLRTIIDNKDPSTLLRSSKVSRRTFHEANFIRLSINRFTNKLTYVKWEYFLYFLVVLFTLSKVAFKILQDRYIEDIYQNEIQVNRIANMLRPSGFIYKESVKAYGQEILDANLTNVNGFDYYRIFEYNWYNMRLSDQINEIGQYFKNTAQIKYSFRPELQEKTISVFGASYTLLLSLFKMTRFLNRDADFNKDIFNDTRVVARKLFTNLMDLYESYNAERGGNIAGTLNYGMVNYLMNLVTAISFVVLILAIKTSIHSFLSKTSLLILKIDKPLLKSAIGNIIQNVNYRTLQKDDVKDADNEELRQAVDIHLNHLDSENSILLQTKRRSKGRKVNQILDKSENRTYSQFTRFVEKNIVYTFIYSCLVILLIHIVILVNIFYSVSFLNTLEVKLDTSAKINLASSSNYFLAGLLYRQHLDQFLGGDLKLTASEFLLMEKLTGYMNSSKNIKDETLMTLITKTNICSTCTDIFKVSSQEQVCINSFETSTDVSALKGFHDVSFSAFVISQELRQTNYTAENSFFETEQFYRFDYTIFYQTVCVRFIANKYMETILLDIDDYRFLSNWLMSIYLVSLVFLLLAVRMYWLPNQLSNWKNLQKTFLALNNDVLSSIYIKSYFGHESQ